MKNPLNKFTWLTILSVPLLLLSTMRFTNKQRMAEKPVGDSCKCYSFSPRSSIPVYFNNKVPGDLASFSGQSQADCFAWQEFIALNWPVDSTHGFGDTSDLSPVQWETYMPRDVLFNTNGTKPPPFGTLVSDEYAAMFKTSKLVLNRTRTKLLTLTSKFGEVDTLTGFGQAAPIIGPNWLGAQNGTNLWYEVLLNKDYYDYVIKNGYYNAKVQNDSANLGIAINFPTGVYQGVVGAIELKAAWMEVDSPAAPKWKRFKLSEATVLDPLTHQLRTTQVALVGLHILHKTQNQPTWVWATFEQVDNVPGGATPPYGYNLYNDNCRPQTVILSNGASVTVPCTPNTAPPYNLDSARPTPIQIKRTNPVDAANAVPVNQKMQQQINPFYPGSVWQYYQLVDVIWSNGKQPVAKNPPINAPINLNVAYMQSGVSIVANTTMESYVQQSNTCFSCHKYSNIAFYPPDSANSNLFGDFSFAIGFAKSNFQRSKKRK
jgi:hypothetical protein